MNDRQFEEAADAAPAAVAAVKPTPAQTREVNRIAYDSIIDRRWDEVAALIAERDRLREDAAAAGRTCDDAIRWASAMQHERDEARAAGRECIAENAALRAELHRWRKAAIGLARRLDGAVAAFDAAVAGNARGGVQERGSAAEGVAEPRPKSRQ